LSLKAGSISFGFKFVDELVELVEVNAGFEPERVRKDLRNGPFPRLCFFAETGPERSVHNFFEGQPKFSGAPLQEPGEIIVNCECSPHETHHGCLES